MTVQDLIDNLLRVHDKALPVFYDNGCPIRLVMVFENDQGGVPDGVHLNWDLDDDTMEESDGAQQMRLLVESKNRLECVMLPGSCVRPETMAYLREAHENLTKLIRGYIPWANASDRAFAARKARADLER